MHIAPQPLGSDVLLETVLLLVLLILLSYDLGFVSPLHTADEHFHIPSKKNMNGLIDDFIPLCLNH